MELRKINRAQELVSRSFAAIEGVILKPFSSWFALSAMCITVDTKNRVWGFPLLCEPPESISKRLFNGAKLGDVMDDLIGKLDTRQEQGATWYFTKGVRNRRGVYADLG